MKITVRSAVPVATPLLLAVPMLAGTPAHAAAGSTDATCVMTGRGTFATAVRPGGADASQSDTLHMTGTVKCVDSAGNLVAAGTFERTVTMPRQECTGDEQGDTSTTHIKWADGTASTFTFDKTNIVKADGTASVTATGSFTPDSARFAGDAINATGSSTGTGCDTRNGETAADSTLVLRLTH